MKKRFAQLPGRRRSLLPIPATLICFAILLCLFMSACSGKRVGNSGGADSDSIYVATGRTSSTEGMYYTAPLTNGGPELLNYVDFETCNHAVVCPKPNCPHADPEECYAMGFGNVIPIDGMMYWTSTESDGKTYIYRAKADGT